MTMDRKEIKNRIVELEERLDFKFPTQYVGFLSEINDGDVFEGQNT